MHRRLTNRGPRPCGAPLRKGCALRSVRGTAEHTRRVSRASNSLLTTIKDALMFLTAFAICSPRPKPNPRAPPGPYAFESGGQARWTASD